MEIAVTVPTHAAEARRVAVRLAIELGFNEAGQANLALVVTEIATNLVKHARSGRVVLSALPYPPGIDIFGIDSGPGMTNVSECMRDGFSTAESAGTGLGAIRRLASQMDVHSSPGLGTAVWARCFVQARDTRGSPSARFDAGAIVVPYQGCTESGDAWTWREFEDRISVLAVDGLGHGPGAAEAARAAAGVFEANAALSAAAILREMDNAVHHTRGAAAAIAQIVPGKRELIFSGIGNIAGVIVNSDSEQHLVSMNGIVGAHMGKPREFTYPWRPTSILVLHSDGVRSKWRLSDYNGLGSKPAALIAAVLWREAARGTDDAAVVVVRERSADHGA